jgi:hypothetical protein
VAINMTDNKGSQRRESLNFSFDSRLYFKTIITT